MNEFVFSNSDLTESEIKELVAAIKESPGFTDYTVEELREYNQKNKVIGLRCSGEICGIATVEHIDEEWAEISTIIVLPKHQGKGLGKKLWHKALKKLSGKNVFAMAFNPVTKYGLALKTGFKRRRFFQLPFALQFFFVVQRFRLHKVIGFFTKKGLRLANLDFFTRLQRRKGFANRALSPKASSIRSN